MKIAVIVRSNKRRFNNDYGCCVAGITEYGDWVRLVADKNGDALPSNNMTPAVNTVIDAVTMPAPLVYQPENAVLYRWHRIDEPINRYLSLIKPSNEKYIFGNTSDCLNKAEMDNIHGSLRLYKVNNLEIYKNGNHKWKVRFKYNKNDYYEIAMTDPSHYRIGFVGDAYIIVSLPSGGGVYNRYYKFVAALIPVKKYAT
jgi:hypothetical protein